MKRVWQTLAHPKLLWAAARDSLWFIPSICTLVSAATAFILVEVEEVSSLQINKPEHYLFNVGAEGARQVLSTIAGSLITVTGVVFSVNMVALQLASSQFTPRILRNFTGNRSNQIVLGVFIGTFTYTLLVLRVIRSKAEDLDEFVPHISVSLAILLVVISIACLIYFIHHSARSMQAAVILSRVTHDALDRVAHLFPQELGAPEPSHPLPPLAEAQQVLADKGGYLQAVDENVLFDLGAKHAMLIRMIHPPGAFVLQGQTLAQVWSEATLDDQLMDDIQNAFVLGEERTPEQDLDFCLLEISDMAVRALSPGINDPTTAMLCIDRLSQVLLARGRREPPASKRTEAGKVHVIARHSTFADSVAVAFQPIVQHATGDPAVLNKLQRSLTLLRQLLPDYRHPDLTTLQETLHKTLQGAKRQLSAADSSD